MRKVIFAVAFAALGNVSAMAQNWPTRPLTMVVPFSAGGSPDVFARILTPRLSELLGQQVIIENVAGAGGMTGASRVAKAAPDGYQLVLGSNGDIALSQTLFRNPPYNAASDFAPVILIAEIPLILIARKDLPANDLQEFKAYVKVNQAKMQFGSAGAGTIAHLACILLSTAFEVNVTHIPYRGGNQTIQDLITGQIDYMCPVVTLAIPQIEGNRVKAISILTKDRSPILPNLASAHEQGLAEFDSAAWLGFFLPKNTPLSIVQKLNKATEAAMNTVSVQQRLKEVGATVVTPGRRSPEYLQKFVVSEIEKWGAVIKAAGVTAQ